MDLSTFVEEMKIWRFCALGVEICRINFVLVTLNLMDLGEFVNLPFLAGF